MISEVQNWFQKELKERGFARYKSRKAYGCRFVNNVEFFVRLNKSGSREVKWHPEFGISAPYPFGISEGMDTIILCFNHICMGEVIENDSSSDSWTEDNKDDILKVLDDKIIPWIDKYSNLESLISHYIDRIDHGIPVLPHKKYQLDKASDVENAKNDPGAELLEMLISSGPPPEAAQKFWGYIAILYNQLGQFDKSKEASENYLKYLKLKNPNPKSGTHPAQVIAKVQSVINDGAWFSPYCKN